MAVSNIYYSDAKTKLNVFEKDTKVGGKFYFVYLSVDKATDDMVSVVKTQINLANPLAKVKTKKGAKSYQISWSHPTSASVGGISLTKEQEMFNAMFNYLHSVGYVDDYDPKTSKTSVAKKTTTKKSSVPTSTNTQSTDIKTLQYYDLFQRKDGMLYRLTSVDNVIDKNDVFYNIAESSLIGLESYDKNAKNYDIQYLPFSGLKKNIKDGTLNYIGQVRAGDEFVIQTLDVSYLVTKVEDYPHDVYYKVFNTDIPAKLIREDSRVMNVFTKSLLGENVSIIRTQLAPTNAPTPTSSYRILNQELLVFKDGKLGFVDGTDDLSDGRRLIQYIIKSGDAVYEKSAYEDELSKEIVESFKFYIGLEFVDSVGNVRVSIEDTTNYPDMMTYKVDGVIAKLYPSQLAMYILSLDYQIKDKNLKNTPTTSTSSAKTEFAVGDKFQYIGITQQFYDTFIVTKIEGGMVYIVNEKKLSIKDADFPYTTIEIGRDFIAEGKIKFITDDKAKSPNTSKPSTKATISNDEINALKKEIADLLFIKSGVSDLDFEMKINLGNEVVKIQKKIDDLNGKLFEQQVGENEFFDRLFEQSFLPLKNRYDNLILNDSYEFIAPNGELSDHDEQVQRIINSKDFLEWFGDWKNAFFYRNFPDFGGLNISKVLNDKFEPQIVWHGTNNQFSYFDFEQFPAIYFAKNKEYSEFFATNKGGQGYLMPFFLSIKNPLDLSIFGNDFVDSKDFFDYMYLKTGKTKEQLMVNPIFFDDVGRIPIWRFIRDNGNMLQVLKNDNVYDGIKFYEFIPNLMNDSSVPKDAKETLAYIIFDSHQSKLADPNRGDIMLASLKSFMLKKGGQI